MENLSTLFYLQSNEVLINLNIKDNPIDEN